MKLKDLEKYLTIKEMEEGKEHYNIMYVDFYSTNPATISPMIFNKAGQLTNDIDLEKIENEFLDKVKELAKKTFKDSEKSLKEKFSFDEDSLTERKMYAKILNGSNYIAANGRIGPANCMVISEEMYHKFNIKNFWKYEVYFAPISDVILYRKNLIEQPGLLMLHNDKKYDFVTTGFQPESQFIILENNIRKKKLERILNK